MLGKLRESRRSDDPDPYRGAQHDVAIRVTGLLWMVGAAAMAAFSPFYPPTAQIGTLGWAPFAFLIALSLVLGYLALTLRFRPSWNQLYASSFNGIGQIAFQQWFAGGGHAPYIQWLLIPSLAIATQRTVKTCVPVILVAVAAAFSPLLYSSIQVSATIAEFTLVSVMALTIAGILTSVRLHRARLRDAGEYAESLARLDALTGLPNRRAFEDALEYAVESSRIQARSLALVLCDVDSFKDVNDRFGHPAGDKCLRAIATELREGVRRPDAAFRWAGDEFAAILHDADEPRAASAAARLCEAVRARCSRPDGEPITLGTGLAALRAGMTADQLLAEADIALLEQKAARRRLRAARSGLATA